MASSLCQAPFQYNSNIDKCEYYTVSDISYIISITL